MENRMKGFVSCRNSYRVYNLFGYASKGIPGIEIIGLGSSGRFVKEKFIYLMRREKVKMPLRRFVLCVEGETKLLKDSDYRWLELPFFILLLKLAGQIQFNQLDDCLASGRVGVDGRVWVKSPDYSELPENLTCYKFFDVNNQNKYIESGVHIFDVKSVFSNFNFSFSTAK